MSSSLELFASNLAHASIWPIKTRFTVNNWIIDTRSGWPHRHIELEIKAAVRERLIVQNACKPSDAERSIEFPAKDQKQCCEIHEIEGGDDTGHAGVIAGVSTKTLYVI